MRAITAAVLLLFSLAAQAQVLGFGSAPQGSIGYNMSSAIAKVMAETAGLHGGDEPIVVPGAGALLLLRPIGRGCAGPRLGETLIDRRSAKAGQLLEQQVAQAGAGGLGQIVGCPRIDTEPQQRLGLLDHRRE